MMYTMDKVEKMLSSAEEEEKEEVEEVEEEESAVNDDEEEEDGVDDEEESGDDKEKDKEAITPAGDETEKKPPPPAQPKDKKQPDVLNLNNEVVKMRKEVKRLRALISRKLARQIAALKKKKGKEMEVERNQRRAARLLEEIHAMKTLSPDLVTKTALQKTLNFEKVCKDPKSSISDRAIARITTHPQFNKKIEGIKAAVKAFKEERMKDIEQGDRRGKVQNQAVEVPLESPDRRGRKGEEEEEEEEDSAVEQKEMANIEGGDSPLKNTKEATVSKPEKVTVKVTPPADTVNDQKKKVLETKSEGPASAKTSPVKDVVKTKPQSQAAEKKPNPKPEVLQTEKDEEESDLEESEDEEKEYFDDSTEERFHKQSSQSEQSDSDDDFFMGKVSKFKKKKKSGEGEEKKQEGTTSTDKLNAPDKIQSELDELESRLKSKATACKTVFCSSLSGSKPGRGRGRGEGAGRGGNKFRGQGRQKPDSGVSRDFSKESKFQKQEKDTAGNFPEGGRKPEERDFAGRGRGRGRGRGDGARHNDRRGGGVFSHQAPPQQALHPSWEASKKRKEQQGQIMAFQGKKIKFDDDD